MLMPTQHIMGPGGPGGGAPWYETGGIPNHSIESTNTQGRGCHEVERSQHEFRSEPTRLQRSAPELSSPYPEFALAAFSRFRGAMDPLASLVPPSRATAASPIGGSPLSGGGRGLSVTPAVRGDPTVLKPLKPVAEQGRAAASRIALRLCCDCPRSLTTALTAVLSLCGGILFFGVFLILYYYSHSWNG